MNNLLNGLTVFRRDGTIFIPLPKEMWAESGFRGKCNCGKCDGDGLWDTLALAEPLPNDLRDGVSYTWTVHYPELRGK